MWRDLYKNRSLWQEFIVKICKTYPSPTTTHLIACILVLCVYFASRFEIDVFDFVEFSIFVYSSSVCVCLLFLLFLKIISLIVAKQLDSWILFCLCLFMNTWTLHQLKEQVIHDVFRCNWNFQRGGTSLFRI